MNTWEQTYNLSGPGAVEVEQRDGWVRIVGWDQPTVRVKATWHGEGRAEDRLEVSATESRIWLGVKPPPRGGLFGLFSSHNPLDLELSLPFGTRVGVESGSGPVEIHETQGLAKVETGSGRVVVVGVAKAAVETGSGSIQARLISGPVDFQTGSGRIDLETAAGPAQLETASGSITARQVSQGLKIETSSGSIAIADVEGPLSLESSSGSIAVSRALASELSAQTGSGSVRLHGIDAGVLSIETGSGTVEAELIRVHESGTYQIQTGSGRVMVTLPPDAGLRLDLETHARVDWGGLRVRVLEQDDDQIKAVLNEGGAHLQIETGSGSIYLKPGQVRRQPPEPPAPPAPPAAPEAADRLVELVREDPALEQSKQMARILKMVEEGKLSVEEAEELLKALGGEGE